MENNIFVETIKQGFRTAVGAATSVVETIQDEQKRNDLFSELNTQWTQKSQEWAEKGEITEQEARRIMEQFMQQKTNQNNTQSSYGNNVSNETNTGSNHSQDIRQLTQEIISLRDEFKNVNISDN